MSLHFDWFKRVLEYERQVNVLKGIYPSLSLLVGLTFKQRRQYWVYYNDTFAGMFRQIGKVLRRLLVVLKKKCG